MTIEEQAHFYGDLKALAARYRTPIWTARQLGSPTAPADQETGSAWSCPRPR